MKLRPMADNIVLKATEAEETTASGIILAAATREKPAFFEVMAAGPDVKEIKVSTRTFDSEATVELPEDLTLKEGENKFDIKVTSENQKVTKVYTVIINKEAKK